MYETLQPDSAARELTTYIRGGYAGRLWTASRWRWMDGALAEVRQEEQDVQPDGEGYVRIVRERRNGALAETSRDTLAEPARAPRRGWSRSGGSEWVFFLDAALVVTGGLRWCLRGGAGCR